MDTNKVPEIAEDDGSCLRAMVVFLWLALFFAAFVYESNARKILSYSNHVEDSCKYDVAVMAYQVLMEKYPLSFCALFAREGLSRIESEAGVVPGERFEMTLSERVLESRGDPYVYYMFPVAACGVCAVVMVLFFLGRIVTRKSSWWPLLLVLVSTILVAIQFVDETEGSLVLTHGFVSSYVEEYPLWLYCASCALVFLVCVTSVSMAAGRKSCLNGDDDEDASTH